MSGRQAEALLEPFARLVRYGDARLTDVEFTDLHFDHVLSTVANTPSPENGMRHGSTLWLSQAAGRRVGVAWSWAEIATGLPVISDLTSISTNAVLVRAGEELHPLQCLPALATAVHRTGWLDAVMEALGHPANG